MSKQLLKIFRAVLLLVFAFSLLQPMMAQKQSAPTSKKSSASATCDGALDIVPAKSMSFARKRRPNRSDAKQPIAPADSKTQPKPANGN